MNNIKLYWNPASQPARAIKSLLEAGKVPHEAINVDLFAGEHKTEKILKLNPSGTVPFIVLNDKSYLESAAILRYLTQKIPSLKEFYPADIEQRAIIDEDLDFCGTVLRPCFVQSFGPHLYAKAMKSDWTDFMQQKEDEAKGKITNVLGLLEKSFETRGYKFRTGNTITIADFQIYCEILDVDYMNKRSIIDNYPKIKAWMEECSNAAGIKEVHEPFAAEGGPVKTIQGLLNSA